MLRKRSRSVRGGDSFVRALALVALTGALLTPRFAAAAPTPRNVLLVANGYYTQKNDLEDHFLDLGYSVKSGCQKSGCQTLPYSTLLANTNRWLPNIEYL
jgi:hypothetical protein